MKKLITITLLSIFAMFLFVGGTILNHRNHMVALEERVNAQYSDNKSSYDNMWKKFKEATQITDIQAEKMKDVYTDIITGRYNDTNLLFKAVKEDNPKLDQSTFTNLQNEIMSSRNAFNNNQKQMSDIIREYNTYVRKNLITATLLNYKTKNTEDFITTSEKTEKAFDTKKDEEIKLK
ncbi:TPA: hypothetical protein PTV74_003242 [Clostridium botulinum]|nr:hypothetical protein [Clostridium botulinum]HDK7206396.1 hypothetical protein [Clostridium botulinum]HDK7210132.1 hypothetical protein [Clostridium botulinum]HDK7265581.1 hypothetical protein [Clostridium botulinum]HDK7269429.1 hypothetical protein [Clostridium botulinum]